MPAAEAYRNGRNPYIHPAIASKGTPAASGLTQAQITEYLTTGNPAQLAQLSQQNNSGVDQRIATPFGKLNEKGERGLSSRELSMAKDMAEMKRSVA